MTFFETIKPVGDVRRATGEEYWISRSIVTCSTMREYW